MNIGITPEPSREDPLDGYLVEKIEVRWGSLRAKPLS